MENYRILGKLRTPQTLLVLLIVLFPFSAFGYDDTTTHPALTQEIVKFYNLSKVGPAFSNFEAELIIQGSIDEDANVRFMNHFYDPIYNRGLTNLAVGVWPTSKEWGTKTDTQKGWEQGNTKKYFTGAEEFTWNRAIYEFAWGDKERGLKTLGHILHLLEDATVPDHTRNDAHPPVLDWGSPYEAWTKQFVRSNIRIDGLERRVPILLSSIGSYFDSIARYSNNNFFSKDTIFDEQYQGPLSRFSKTENLKDGVSTFLYGRDSFGEVYRLVEAQGRIGQIENKYFIKDNNSLVLSDYWRLLSRQAVLHGAGVVKLFFDEVEKERQTHVLRDRNRSTLSKILDETISFFRGSSDTSSAAIIAASNQSPQVIVPQVHTASGVVAPTPSVVVTAPQTILSPSTAQKIASVPPTTPTQVPVSVLVPAPVIPTPVTPLVPFPGFGGGSPQSTPPSPQSTPPVVENSPPVVVVPAPVVVVDTTPPDVSFSIVECAESLSPGSCLIATSTVHLVWASAAGDLDSFELTRDSVSIATNDTATTSVLVLGESTFSIAARDTAGNISQPQVIRVEMIASPVVINEVGWSGTRASGGDQWIELFNPTESVIDLRDMILFSKTKRTPFVPLAGSIPPRSFYLIESGDDNVISTIPADLVASFGEGISFSGERLALGLKRAGQATTTVDETFFCSQWCGKGVALPATSMERYSAFGLGTELDNWDSNNRVIVSGRNRATDVLFGTPGARNSISGLINKGRDVSVGTVRLLKVDSPYLVARVQSVAPGASLIAEPGTVVKFAGSGGLSVGGTIQALGTESDPAVFIGLADDDFGGDMDLNGPLPTGVDPSFWKGITVFSGATDTLFRHAVVRNGKAPGTPGANIFVTDASAVFDHLTTERAFKVGLLLSHSDSEVTDSIFRDIPPHSNGAASNFAFGVIAESGGNQVYRRNQFIDVDSGLQTTLVGGTIEDNVFTRIPVRAVEIRSFQGGRISGNTGSGNGSGQQQSVGNALVLQGSVSIGATTTLGKSPGFSYLIDNQTIPLGGAVVAEPGVVVKYKSGGLRVDGRLEVRGTPEDPVRFTSIADDSDGSDAQSNGDVAPQILNLSGLTFQPSSTSLLENMNIRFAFPAITYQDPSPLFLRNVTFENHGLGVQGSPSSVIDLVENLTFVNVAATTSPSSLLGN